MTRPPYRRVVLLLTALTQVLFYGCSGRQPKIVAPPAPVERAQPAAPSQASPSKNLPIAHYRGRRFYVHQVRWPNESLALIAQWYTGRRGNWKALSRATPNLRHNRIHPGDVVFIPLDLLQIETPMPQQYVQPRRSPAVKPDPGVPAPENEVQPQPYGPRPYPKKTNS